MDVGTSAIKAAAFDAETGRAIASHRVGYMATTAQPGQAELDAEIVWTSFVEAVRAIATADTVRRDPIKAMSWSASGDEVLLVDEFDRPLGPVILSADTRGAEQIAELNRQVDGADMARRTGLPIYPAHPLVRLLWYRAAQPRVLAEARQALGWAEWIQLRLGLEPVADDASASRWMTFDVVERRWFPEVLEALGLPTRILPRTAVSGTAIGEIPTRGVDALGLHGAIEAVTGAFDQVAATLGSGVWQSGDAAVGTGTWEVLTAPVTPATAPDAGVDRGIGIGAFAGPTSLAAFALNPGGGSLLAWFAGVSGRCNAEDAPDPVAVMVAAAPDAPSHIVVLPHFQGSPSPEPDPRARGLIAGLTLATTASDLVRGILEGITFQLRANLEALREMDVAPARIRNSGGGSRSPAWAQLKADVLGVPVETVAVEETGCFAAALLAGLGTRAYDNLPDTISAFVRVADRYEPRAWLKDQYDDSYGRFRRLASASAPVVNAGEGT